MRVPSNPTRLSLHTCINRRYIDQCENNNKVAIDIRSDDANVDDDTVDEYYDDDKYDDDDLAGNGFTSNNGYR